MKIDATNFRPLRGLVLVRRELPESVKDGIIIPEAWRQYGWRATVIRSGPDAQSYIEGEDILFLKEFTVLPFADRTLALTDSKHVLAKLTVVENVEVIVPQNKFVMVEPHEKPKKLDAIYLSDKAYNPVRSGYVVRKSVECHEVRVDCTAWFNYGVGVTCVEDGIEYKLMDESEILAMQIGGET